jgi:hypothetical protein
MRQRLVLIFTTILLGIVTLQAQTVEHALSVRNQGISKSGLKWFNNTLYTLHVGDPEYDGIETDYPDSITMAIIGLDFPNEISYEMFLSGGLTGKINDYCFDEDKSVYIQGSASGINSGDVVYLGPHLIEVSPFLVKIDSLDQLMWQKHLPGFSGHRLEMHNNYLYTSGTIWDELFFAGDTLDTASENWDLPSNSCLLKISDHGEEMWGRVVPGVHTQNNYDLEISSNGQVYICGETLQDEIEFGGEEYGKGGFLCAYSNLGEELWIRQGIYDDNYFVGSTGFHSIACTDENEVAVLIKSSADYFPNSIQTLSFECVSDTYHEAIYKWNDSGELLEVANLGCRDSGESDGDLYWQENAFYYATHINESTHLTEQGVPGISDDETLLLAMNENLEPLWNLISDSSEGWVALGLSLAFNSESIFLAGLYQGTYTFGDQELESVDGLDGYIFEIKNPNDIEVQYLRAYKINVFPNPVQKGDEFIIETLVNLSVEGYEIWDLSGKIIAQGQNPEQLDQIAVSTEGMDAGLYCLVCYLNDGTNYLTRIVMK